MATSPARSVAIKLDDDVRARVERLADARHRTPHSVMNEAIRQYVEREERREAFRQQTMEAWEDYRATGLHATAAEADAWLERLERGDDADPPRCHD